MSPEIGCLTEREDGIEESRSWQEKLEMKCLKMNGTKAVKYLKVKEIKAENGKYQDLGWKKEGSLKHSGAQQQYLRG